MSTQLQNQSAARDAGQLDPISIAIRDLRSSVGVGCAFEVWWSLDGAKPWDESQGAWGGNFGSIKDLRKYSKTHSGIATIHASKDGGDCDTVTCRF